MQASDDKSWEQFIDKVMQEAQPEHVSNDFTEKVLATLESQQATVAVTRYKSPISRLTWLVLGIVFAAVIIWSTIAGTSTQWDWTSNLVSYMDVSAVLERVTLPSLEYSSLYSIGFFALFVLLQLMFMKRFFDRRLGLE